MNNKAILREMFKSENVAQAYADIRSILAREVLSVTRDLCDIGCKPTRITPNRDGDTIFVIDDKGYVWAVYHLKGTEWAPTPGSKLTPDEFEKYTNSEHVAECLRAPAAKAAYGDDAMQPFGLIPVEDAVEIYSRGMGKVHQLVVDYYAGNLPEPVFSRKKVDELIYRIDTVCDDTSLTSMLTALAYALDNRENGLESEETGYYSDFLVENAFGADKLVHALEVGLLIVDHEEKVLLGKETRSSLRERLLAAGSRHTKAVRKVADKLVLIGRRPFILLRTVGIRAGIVKRSTYITD